MFSWCGYLIVGLFVFSHLGFWGGGLFLIAPFPDLCLLVLFKINTKNIALHKYYFFRIIYWHVNFYDKPYRRGLEYHEEGM